MSIPVVHVPASLNIHRCIFSFFFVQSLRECPLESFLYEGLGVWLKPCSLIMHIEWTETRCCLAFYVLKEREGEGCVID